MSVITRLFFFYPVQANLFWILAEQFSFPDHLHFSVIYGFQFANTL